MKQTRANNTKPSILEVENVTIRRSDTLLLESVNWRIQPGQHWVMLGANGSGKTSLLSAVTGYLAPTFGRITVLGQTYGQSDWRQLRRKIGLVSSSVRQMMANGEPALETVISGKYAMIDYWGRPSPSDRKEGMKILASVEAEYLADRPWLFLSQGERQRVLIGRALMAHPPLLILDEPCAGLDPVAREHFLQFLNRLGRQHHAPTLVLVTHHVEEIMPVFRHTLMLRKGRVHAAGSLRKQMTAKILSQLFDAQIVLEKFRGRYGMRVAAEEKGVL